MEDVSTSEKGLNTGLYGDIYYADISRICTAAGHAGQLTNEGGLFEIRIEKGWGPYAHAGTIGYNQALGSQTRNFIKSYPLGGWDRTFTVRAYPLETDEVYTLAGPPEAPLHDACGFTDGQPPQEAQVGIDVINVAIV